MMQFENHVGPDACHAMWQTIAHHLGGQDLASIRAVCRMSRRAVDDAVNHITLSSEAMQCVMPRQERFPACKQYTFIDTSENVPLYVRQCCGPPTVRTRVLVYGEACWMAPHLQKWIRLYQEKLSWVGLVLRLCEEHQYEDLSFYLRYIQAVGCGLELSFLGFWCEREGRVLIVTDIYWARKVAETVGIRELYAEYVHIDVAVLQDCTALSHLHVVFYEWPFCNTRCFSAMDTLHTLCLEADSAGTLECNMLYELGQHIRVLRILGGAASQPFVEIPDWKDFLFTLFERLGSLECFETALDVRKLMFAKSTQSEHEEPWNSRNSTSVWKFWHLYVVVDRHSLALKGVLRSRDNMDLLRNICVE